MDIHSAGYVIATSSVVSQSIRPSIHPSCQFFFFFFSSSLLCPLPQPPLSPDGSTRTNLDTPSQAPRQDRPQRARRRQLRLGLLLRHRGGGGSTSSARCVVDWFRFVPLCRGKEKKRESDEWVQARMRTSISCSWKLSRRASEFRHLRRLSMDWLVVVVFFRRLFKMEILEKS